MCPGRFAHVARPEIPLDRRRAIKRRDKNQGIDFMTSTIRYAALSALIALGASAVSPAAWAQDDHRGARPAGDRPNADQMHARMQAMHEAHERQRAADLRTILRLRPDQEGALTAFLASHKPPMGGPNGGGKGGEHRGPRADGAAQAAPMTTPQRLDEMSHREAEHAAMRQRHVDALKAFYAALSPDQKQVFDALQRLHGGGHGGHGGHGHGGWGHPGFGGMRGPGGPGGPPPRDD
jgi:hypothetical protein